MDWFWRLVGHWQSNGPSKIRRVIVLVIDGLDSALVDDYLGQGLLHHLALLGDIGGRAPLINSAMLAAGGSLCDAVGELGVRSVELRPVVPWQSADLAAICTADREQQERLYTALGRSRPPVVVGVFDMPARVEQLFGPRPDESQRLVLCDVYARMDEIVGKAFSFVDEQTALLVVVGSQRVGEVAPPSARTGLLFSSRKLSGLIAGKIEIESAIAALLRSPPRDS